MEDSCWLITGASGWFGRTALWELEQLIGPRALRRQVVLFASSSKTINFGSPYGSLQARALEEIDQVPTPRGLLHLAFLTREHVLNEGLEAYILKNRSITAAVARLIEKHPTLPIITTSSGAAAALDGRDPDLANDPYATLKQEEERLWEQSAGQRMAVVFRVYAASGRFLRDPTVFALGDFIQKALDGKPITLRSTRPVIRSYIHVGTLMRLAWIMLQDPLPSGYYQIDAVTETLDLEQLAEVITSHWQLPPVQSSIDQTAKPDHYAGNPIAFRNLLSHYKLHSPTFIEQIKETASALNNSLAN
jgi:nucleoside-diphosphate-sugar epimerase